MSKKDLEDYEMTFGKHKGEKIGNLDASYLLWLVDECEFCPWQVKKYVEELEVELEKEAYGERYRRKGYQE